MLAAMAMSAAAQDTYTNVQMATEDLNGTARYVGMGGAMEALGADISTMGTNPAGIGLIRKNQVSATGGLQIVGGNTLDNNDAKSATFGLNQIGLVWVTKTGDLSNVNLGFNYHKSRNFNQLFDVTNSLSNASQNKASYDKYADGVMNVGYASESIIDDLYNRNLMYYKDEAGAYHDYYDYYNATRFRSQHLTSGYIGDYDFNISGNINNRIYLGATVTLRDVHYKNSSMYTEELLDIDDATSLGIADVTDVTRITGTGYNVKFGAIFRPIETSPFRFGVYMHTPTWYRLTRETQTYLDIDFTDDSYISDKNHESLDFAINTPWKFGASVGHTVGTFLALGATYEYSKYNAMDNRVIDGYDYNSYYGTTRALTSKDAAMNANTRESLKGVHTVKVGAELRPMPELAIRAGYNFLSAMYNKDGYRDGELESQGVWCSGTTDYTNWDATHRFTCGLGYNVGSFNIDLAYQYTTTKGTYYPFQPVSYSGTYAEDSNMPTATSVKDNRHQLSLTVGYKF